MMILEFALTDAIPCDNIFASGTKLMIKYIWRN
jgi:hypothetical protein